MVTIGIDGKVSSFFDASKWKTTKLSNKQVPTFNLSKSSFTYQDLK